jgi:lipoprotein-anchoring transpeptidase ErfK/SrfK
MRRRPGVRVGLAATAAVVGALVASGCGAAVQASNQARPVVPAAGPATSSPALSVPAAAPKTAAVAAATTPPTPATTPCTNNARSRYVFVSLRRQRMWMCAKHRVAYATPITSGMVGPDTATPTGTFHVEGRTRNTVLTLNTGATYDVKYWIPFDAPLFGFHDSSWQDFPYGSAEYRTAGSHGCVHMPLKAIKFFYGWTDIGTTVRIRA